MNTINYIFLYTPQQKYALKIIKNMLHLNNISFTLQLVTNYINRQKRLAHE